MTDNDYFKWLEKWYQNMLKYYSDKRKIVKRRYK